MTDDRMALVDLLQKSGDGDFLRAVAEAVLQILMEADVEGLIGAGRHERSATGSITATDIASVVSTRAWARCSCGFPSGARDRTARLPASGAGFLRCKVFRRGRRRQTRGGHRQRSRGQIPRQ